MVKKRLIFTLLYNDGGFMLSRNFRLQRAGDIQWLKSNYNFKKIAFTIDELIILDVSLICIDFSLNFIVFYSPNNEPTLGGQLGFLPVQKNN